MSDVARYPGQGKDIPASFGRGAWIYEPALYLSLDDADNGMGDPAGRGAVEVAAGRVASSLRISVDALLEANSAGALTFSNRRVPARAGDGSDLEFVFRIGDKVGQPFVLAMGRNERG